MKDCYKVKSERYGYVHEFQKSFGKDNYTLKLQDKGMHLQLTLDPATKKIKTVDPDGGPVFYEGWRNNEFEIKDIYEVGTVIFFSLSEANENPQQ